MELSWHLQAENLLTPVSQFNGWWAKREDLAFATGPDFPAGSKVRQYVRMAQAQPDTPMLVGCSANSAMQIYVAAAAYQQNVPGIVYTAQRAQRTAATLYAERLGTEVVEVRPGYLSYCQKLARVRATALGAVVRWDAVGALKDAAAQCANVPEGATRVVVATGSGLTCSGVLAGLAERGFRPTVVAVAVSAQARQDTIIANALKLTKKPLPVLEFVRCASAYDEWTAARLPDGTPLDPFYAAKALAYIQPGDCFWIPGVRPLSSMPHACQEAYA